MAIEPYQTSISNSALRKIRNMMLQGKVAGKTMNPAEMEAAYAAALSTEADRASANYFRGKELSLREQSQTDTREATAAGERNASKAAIGQAATTGLGLYLMRDKTPVDKTPGIGDKISASAGKIYDSAAEGTGKLWDKVVGKSVGQQVAQGTTPVAEAAPVSWSADPTNSPGTPLAAAPAAPAGTPKAPAGSSPWDYALPVAGGFVGEGLSRTTGLGEWTSNRAPVGGSKDWNRAAGSGVAAGLASLAGANPWVAAGSYLAASIGMDKLFGT